MRISDWSSDVCSSDLMQKWLRRPVYSLRVVPGERGAYEEAAASKGSRTGVLASPAYYRLPDDGGFGLATIRQPVAAVDRSKLQEVGNNPAVDFPAAETTTLSNGIRVHFARGHAILPVHLSSDLIDGH